MWTKVCGLLFGPPYMYVRRRCGCDRHDGDMGGNISRSFCGTEEM